MRYWAYFAAKLIVAAAVFYGLLALLGPLAPDDSAPVTAQAPKVQDQQPPPSSELLLPDHTAPGPYVKIIPPGKPPASHKSNDDTRRAVAPLTHGNAYLAINLALMVWFVLAAGTLYVIVRDQRFRCRVCLRRLRMPVETGSRGFMLMLGRPRTEYICPYGHGTLKQEEFQTSELENPEWTGSSGDMWEDLYAASKQSQDEK